MLASAIEELRIKNNALEEAFGKIQQRNFELSQISYRTFHNMREPMVTLQGLVYLLKMEMESETTDNLLNQVLKLIGKLDNFSESLSEYTEIIQNDFKTIEIKIAEIPKIIKKIADKYDEFSSIVLNINITNNTELKHFLFDERRFIALFKIFISNAIQHRDVEKEPMSISVDINITETKFEAFVCDNGMGIEQEAKENLFKMFFKGSGKSDGSGLGLYIAKNIIDEVGGNLNIDSEEGKGALVTLSFPIKL